MEWCVESMHWLLDVHFKEREFDRKNHSSRNKKPSCILESENTEGFLGRKE